MAKVLGLNRYKDDIIRMYVEEKKTAKEISNKYQCGLTAIYDILKKNNINSRPRKEYTRKYKYNEHYMDKIDTPERAYVLGLLYADGTNNTKNHSVALRLSSIDIDILNKIKQLFEAEQSITIVPGKVNNSSGNYSHETAGLVFVNTHLSNKLASYGMCKNKTFQLHFPKWIPKELLPHFIRGLFDGDGGITISKRKTPYVHYTGDYNFLEELSQVIEENGFKNYLKPKQSKSGKVGSIHIYAQSTVKAFLDWIYKDSTIYINRKYERYYSYFYENKPLRKYSDDEKYQYDKTTGLSV